MSVADPWAAERRIAEMLEAYRLIDGLDQIPPDAFVIVAHVIGQFRARPVTDAQLAAMKAWGKKRLAERAILKQAAKILRDDAKGWRGHPSMARHVAAWDSAISILEKPRGVTELPGSWIVGTATGVPMRPWAFMATEIAARVVQVLKGYGVKASLRDTSGLIKFIRDSLIFIGAENIPSAKVISRTVSKNIENIGIN